MTGSWVSLTWFHSKVIEVVEDSDKFLVKESGLLGGSLTPALSSSDHSEYP